MNSPEIACGINVYCTGPVYFLNLTDDRGCVVSTEHVTLPS